MVCYVRLMRRKDITQVTEIHRETFPTLWPPANYQHELENRLAHYIVACEEGERVEEPEMKAVPQKGLSGLVSRLMSFFNLNRFLGKELSSSGGQYILGFVGFWIMAGEAHMINIAVREADRRHGIGELLLIGSIALATELKASIIILEVRASNIAAQSLYRKYGFTQVGLRRGYYTDNREDGVLMSTENISLALFQENLSQLKQAHFRKWGLDAYQIAQ